MTKRRLLLGEDNTVYFWGIPITDYNTVKHGDIAFYNSSKGPLIVRNFSTTDDGTIRFKASDWEPYGICILSSGDVFDFPMFVGVQKAIGGSYGTLSWVKLNLNQYRTGSIFTTPTVSAGFSCSVLPTIDISSDSCVSFDTSTLSMSNTGSFPSDSTGAAYAYRKAISSGGTYYWGNYSAITPKFLVHPVLEDPLANIKTWYDTIINDPTMYYTDVIDLYETDLWTSSVTYRFLGDNPEIAVVSGVTRKSFYKTLANSNSITKTALAQLQSKFDNRGFFNFVPSMWDISVFQSRFYVYRLTFNKLKNIYAIGSTAEVNGLIDSCDGILLENINIPLSSKLVAGIYEPMPYSYILPFFILL